MELVDLQAQVRGQGVVKAARDDAKAIGTGRVERAETAPCQLEREGHAAATTTRLASSFGSRISGQLN